MGSSVGIRALQQHASAVVARVAGGEAVDVTDRGRLVARLVPIADGRLAGMVAAGTARPARRRVSDLPDPLSASPTGPTLGDLLAESRADER